MKLNNAVATMLQVIAIVIWAIDAFATFCILTLDVNILEVLGVFCGAFLIGVIFWAFGEAVSLLQKIADNTK